MTIQPVNQSIEAKPLEGEVTGKFWINEEVFCFNTELQPLITKFQIKGIRENDNRIYYTHNLEHWIREDFVYKNKFSAYRSLIKQAEMEMRGDTNDQA